jgi:hypothetical protein
LTGVVLGVHLVAAAEGSVDAFDTARPGIYAQDRAAALDFIELQRAPGGQHQFWQSGAQVGPAGIQLIDDDLLIAGGQYAAQLAAAPIALLGEVAFGRHGCLGSAGHTGQVGIQDLPSLRVIVPVALAVVATNLV